jgi:hypothetical protein
VGSTSVASWWGLFPFTMSLPLWSAAKGGVVFFYKSSSSLYLPLSSTPIHFLPQLPPLESQTEPFSFCQLLAMAAEEADGTHDY